MGPLLKKYLELILLIVIILGGIWFLFFAEHKLNLDKNAPPDANQNQPAPVEEPEKNIIVIEPVPFATIGAFTEVRGRARTFESGVEFAVKDGFGEVLTKSYTIANAPDAGQFGDFQIEIFIPAATTPVGTIEVYWSSPKDGAPLDVVSIPVTFPTEPKKKIKVFFTNSELDPEITCLKVFPVEREIYPTERVGAAALEELLRGPTDADRERKYGTTLPTGAKLKSLVVENGVARADFDEGLEAGVGGSCRVAAIRVQITETLKQFSAVNKVIISINGRTEDILQP